ncbi:MAG: DUF4011 domain-containing protein, partial [Alphaproteobacteria bacterium]|nr:DUF4011 domain-containing protein [Alphaproteobacteria bacterium]
MASGVPVESPVRIEVSLTPRLNLAFHQNAVPFLRELLVVNDGENDIANVTLRLASEPGFLTSREWRIDGIGRGQRFHVSGLDVALDAGLLSRLTEAEAAQVVFTLASADGGEVARLVQPIELLPRTHWSGIGHVPEMVAAFVQPNDPAVERILVKAADVLREHGRDPALNGYQGGPKRAWELASAIWTAVGARGLTYALPPASFEHAGQKVRAPSHVLDSGLATCLDSTLLFCACLEQCGLNPVVVFTRGHAFAGLWLKAEEFSTAVIDDVTALRKRAKLNELLLFETTHVTERPLPAFGRAVERGARQIAESEDEAFEMAVDVRRARMQRIRPLASAEAAVTEAVASAAELEPTFEAAPDLPDDAIIPDEVPTTPQGRLDRWQRKLLDLSLRNGLLNFRASKRVIQLDAPDPGRIEDLLALGRRLRLSPRPDVMDGADPRSDTVYQRRFGEDGRRSHAIEALDRDQVFVGLTENELDSRLVDLFRQARANLQEGGANTLFLALGFLVWRRGDADEKGYRAPLILLPVTLERKSIRSGFSLLAHEDEPRFNPTLLEMLRQDFKLHLPYGDGDLPKDDHGLDIAGIWRHVAHAVKDLKGWEVAEEVALSTFSFAKFLMWKDMVDRTDQLKRNPVVRHLIDTPRDPYPRGDGFIAPRTLDAALAPDQTFCPLPADSSQLSAVMTAARGKDFVLVGPPGTGKSQTIANLIAQCLAERKTVLFVSEKIAALDVVYRRLRDVGLGDFCLELHSNKARKLDVIEQLRQAWEAKGVLDAEEWRQEAQRLKRLRDELNAYVEHLHAKHRNGLTAYLAMGRIIADRALPRLGLSWPSVDAHGADQYRELADLAESLDVHVQAIGVIGGGPLAVVAHGEWSPHWQQSLLRSADSVVTAADDLTMAAQAFRQAAGLPDLGLGQRAREGLASLATSLPRAAGRDWRFVLRSDAGAVAESLRAGLDLLKRHREAMSALSPPWHLDLAAKVRRAIDLVARHREVASALSVPFAPDVAALDATGLRRNWERAESAWFLGKMFGKRRVRKALAPLVPRGREPDLPADLDHLIALRQIEADIGALRGLAESTGAPWVGLDTDLDRMEAALRFQGALGAARGGAPWDEQGLSVVADGRCGPAMAAELGRLRHLRELERQIAALADLGPRSGGVWAGLRTDIDEVERALAFQASLTTAISLVASTAEEVAAVKGRLERLIGDGNA